MHQSIIISECKEADTPHSAIDAEMAAVVGYGHMSKCMFCRVTTTMEMTGRCMREASFGSIRSTLWAGLLGRSYPMLNNMLAAFDKSGCKHTCGLQHGTLR